MVEFYSMFDKSSFFIYVVIINFRQIAWVKVTFVFRTPCFKITTCFSYIQCRAILAWNLINSSFRRVGSILSLVEGKMSFIVFKGLVQTWTSKLFRILVIFSLSPDIYGKMTVPFFF